MPKVVEINGIKWYPDTVKEMDEQKFILAHKKISPFKDLKEATAIAQLKEVYKKLK